MRFGALWNTSASVFESAFHHLKRSVTGSKKEGRLIVQRFMRHKLLLAASFKTQTQTFAIGRSKPISSLRLRCVLYSENFEFQQNDLVVERFCNCRVTFHSAHYQNRSDQLLNLLY